MRRVLGALLLLVGVGAPLAFAQVAGFVHGEFELDLDGPWPDAVGIAFELGVEYSVDDWTFGALLDIQGYGLENLAFLTTGSLGPFDVYSLFWLWDLFGIIQMTDWENAIWIDVSGVELWAFFSVQTEDWFFSDLSGAGLALGGHGAAGDVEIWAEISFNLADVLPFIYWNGLEYTMDSNLACDLFEVIDPTCGLDFSFAEFYLDFPFCCAEVGSWLGFDCDGFYGFEIWVQDIAIGETGLVLEWVDLWFEVDGKELDLWFGLDIGDVVCISPFVSLVEEPPLAIDGIEVDGLELVCTLGDATITVSELLSDDDWYIGIDGAIHPNDWPKFDDLVIPSDCVDEMHGVEEAIAIEVSRGGCCGGESFLGLYSFFDIDLDDAMFDWLGLRARAKSSVSSSLSLYLETWIWYDGVESIAVGIDVTWGTLRNLTGDWTCCLDWF